MKPLRLFISSVQKEFAEERGFASIGGQVERQVTPPVAPPVTQSVTPPVEVLVRLLGEAGALGNTEIHAHLGRKERS